MRVLTNERCSRHPEKEACCSQFLVVETWSVRVDAAACCLESEACEHKNEIRKQNDAPVCDHRLECLLSQIDPPLEDQSRGCASR